MSRIGKSTLKDFPKIESNIKTCNVRVIKALHFVAFVCNVLDLDYSGPESNVITRICSFMNDLAISNNDNKTEDESSDEEDEEEPEDHSQDEEDEEVQETTRYTTKEKNRTENGRNKRNLVRVEKQNEQRKSEDKSQRRDSFALSFRDVEDTIRQFDGKDDYPVRRWIMDFEEMAELTGWNDLQKLIFAKKCLGGLAKLFVQSENGINTWHKLKNH
ncbi:unnamed protein product [Psylliodes chrysocephalus]|uniref:Uncharacterized protein n=1 Tax=Psylliodes chrysocephalus TaxID=3402493 RepID=A0A9P0CTP9_9CUCU|nr:unnamed protein product [Psylliodes chrysocephala]